MLTSIACWRNSLAKHSPIQKSFILMPVWIVICFPYSKQQSHIRIAPPPCIRLHFFFAEKFNFENLYISFLDQFQGCSYGDKTFGALVMVPLAQKHNIKWRHMLWSEHVHVLRFATCTEDEVNKITNLLMLNVHRHDGTSYMRFLLQLIGTLDDYLNPPESDKILLKSYYQAINSHILLPNTIPYKIAEHHVNAYKTKLNQRTCTAVEPWANEKLNRNRIQMTTN